MLARRLARKFANTQNVVVGNYVFWFGNVDVIFRSIAASFVKLPRLALGR